MKLKYDLPKKIINKYLAKDEEVLYCLPFDLDERGKLAGKRFAAATDRKVYVFADDKKIHEYEYGILDEVKLEAQVNGGLIRLTSQGKQIMLLRFTQRYLIQYSYFAKGVENLIEGDMTLVVSHEPDRHCPVCDRILVGNGVCPACSSKWRFMKRMSQMIKPHSRGFTLITVMMLFNSFLMVLARYVEKRFIDDVLLVKDGDWRHVLLFFSLLLLVNGTTLYLMIFNNKKSAHIGTDISKSLREQLYSKLQECDLAFIDKRSPGELINRVNWDTRRIQHFFETAFSRMFSTVLTMIAAVVMMFTLDYKITLFALATTPVILFVSFIWRKKIRRIFRAQWILEDRANTQLQDALSGIKVVKSYGMEEYYSERFFDANERLADRQEKNEKFWAAFHPLVSLGLALTTLIVLYMGASNVINKVPGFTIGTLAQFTGYAAMLLGPLNWISMFPRQFMHAVTSMERIYDVLDEVGAAADQGDKIQKERIEGYVKTDKMKFGYKPYETVLKDVSIDVKPGEMIGIVGPSGAGKTTLINLIIGLYTPDEGKILIDGKPLDDYDSGFYHSQIGVVLQENFLFASSVLENIRYAKPDASLEEVIRAAKIANAHDFITLLPDGYNSKIGDRGSTLSGGERQRIAIARAILSNPAILFLDEATSSLDTETEFRIQEAIQRLTKGRTTFAIAHRLSTLRKSDRILVIDGNRIVEFGNHKELMMKKGLYYSLVTAQLKMSRVDKKRDA